nr:SDR family oxidoreductase [Paraburkholderia caribensis]
MRGSSGLGKRALVTGGSRGIGAAIALALAENGADVALTFQHSADRAQAVVASIRNLGRRAAAIKADIAAAVTFLASPAARHVTGTILTVDGGLLT